tara:strand:+ start:1913 stop:2215 length:303 start_codon:yes stop_codon:yes gene_type:complete
MRYNTNRIVNRNGKRYLQSYVLGDIPKSNPEDIFIEVTTTDRLDNLADKFYGNSNLWWVIAQANALGKGTLYIKEGAILRLPANPNIILNSNKNNNSSGY